MSISNTVVSLVLSKTDDLSVRWINTGRVSVDWKAKVFQSTRKPIQFAIYDLKSVIQVLLEYKIEPVVGTWLHDNIRPISHALNDSNSHFSNVRGICYRADSEASFLALLSSYFDGEGYPSIVVAQSEPKKTLAQILSA